MALSYQPSADITITLASLANGTARQSLVVDNTVAKYLDVGLELQFELVAGSPASDKAIMVWAYTGVGTRYQHNASGADASITMQTPTNLYFVRAIATPSGGAAYPIIIPSLAAIFNNVMPQKWGLVVENRTGVSFHATESNHVKKYYGIL